LNHVDRSHDSDTVTLTMLEDVKFALMEWDVGKRLGHGSVHRDN
jgi:hypothetical protein